MTSDQASPRYHDVSKLLWPPLVSAGPLTAELTIVGAVSHLTGAATTASHLNSSDTLWPEVKLRDHQPQLQPRPRRPDTVSRHRSHVRNGVENTLLSDGAYKGFHNLRLLKLKITIINKHLNKCTNLR